MPAGFVVGSEGVADSSTEGCSDGDVLDVGVVRCESSGGGSGLVEGAVDASGGRVDHFRKRVGVGGLQLCEFAVSEDGIDELVDAVVEAVGVPHAVEGVGVHRPAGLEFAGRRRVPLVDEDGTDLPV